MANKGNIWDYLIKCWDDDSSDIQERAMNDVALIEAILHPKYATIREFYGPPENTHRKIRVYTKIKTESMMKDFWNDVEVNTGF
jgi:hypothetical protein